MQSETMFAQATTFLDGLVVWAAQALPRLFGALALLVVGLWLASWAARHVDRFIEHESRIDPTLRGVLSSVVRYAILIIVLVAVLGQLGIQTTSILATLGAIGLAIGLALQGTLSNIAAGVMLLWLRPFRVGDYIDAGGIAGTVKEVGLFATELHSWDGVFQFVPNAELWNKRLTNFNRLPTRLIELKFGIAYDDDIPTGKSVLMDLAQGDARILKDPQPLIFVSALGDSAVELTLRAWAQTADYWPAYRSLNEAGKLALEAAGMSIPFPQRDVHVYGLEGAKPSNGGGPSPSSTSTTSTQW